MVDQILLQAMKKPVRIDCMNHVIISLSCSMKKSNDLPSSEIRETPRITLKLRNLNQSRQLESRPNLSKVRKMNLFSNLSQKLITIQSFDLKWLLVFSKTKQSSVNANRIESRQKINVGNHCSTANKCPLLLCTVEQWHLRHPQFLLRLNKKFLIKLNKNVLLHFQNRATIHKDGNQQPLTIIDVSFRSKNTRSFYRNHQLL